MLTRPGKTQAIRLFDVIFVGPVLMYSAWKLPREHSTLRRTLGVLGAATVLYNGNTYLALRRPRAMT